MADLLEKDFGFGHPEGMIEGAKVYDDLFEEPDPDKIDTTTLSALTYTYPEKEGVSVKLLYQQNYGKETSDGDLAYYNPQRPDIVLVIERGKDVFTYLFDAKYRIDERGGKDASPAEPINDMHRYRDAILYRSQEGDHKLSRQIVGAYVLYPGRPLPQSYNYAELIKNENIGAIPLLPGEDGGSALKSFIGEILSKKTPESHLSADIPTRGTTVVVGKDEGEFLENEVVYGTYAAGQLDWILEKHMYNLPVDEAEKFGIVDMGTAEQKKILYLVAFRGTGSHRVFRLLPGVCKVTPNDLWGMGYPRQCRYDEYWLFKLGEELGLR